jgi:hypothetical protein
MFAFERAWSIVKYDAISSATRDAELWVMNTEATYFHMIQVIKQQVKAHLNWGWDRKEVKNEILEKISIELPELMANDVGFMDDLATPLGRDDTTGAALSDVDWLEVARNFEEDIDEAMNNYPEEWL